MGITTTTALIIGTVASAVVSAGGAALQARAALKQAEFQSTVQRQQAERERQIAAAQEEDFRRRQSRLMAARRAAGGASGVQTGTGSPLLASEDFAAETELQALRIRAGGETQATRLEQQAALTRSRGRSARTAGLIGAGTSLLSGATRTARILRDPVAP